MSNSITRAELLTELDISLRNIAVVRAPLQHRVAKPESYSPKRAEIIAARAKRREEYVEAIHELRKALEESDATTYPEIERVVQDKIDRFAVDADLQEYFRQTRILKELRFLQSLISLKREDNEGSGGEVIELASLD